MSHYRIVFFFALTCLLMTSSARAQSIAPSAERGLELLTELQMSTGQRQKGEAILLAARKDAIRMRADIEIAGIDLRIELEKDNPGEKAVGDLIEKMSSLEGQLWKSRVVAWIQVRKLLGFKQRRQLDRLRSANGSNIVKTQGEFINPFADYDQETRRESENSRLRDPFAAPRRQVTKASPNDRGEVNIRTIAPAKIFVDGKHVGSSPLSLRLDPGKHQIRSVFLDGSAPVVRTISVKATTNMTVQLQ